jgi:anion-transporting  ArsA/GET3 family ATPase
VGGREGWRWGVGAEGCGGRGGVARTSCACMLYTAAIFGLRRRNYGSTQPDGSRSHEFDCDAACARCVIS